MSRNQMGFWRALERLAAGAVVLEWKRELGADFPRARPFLQLSTELSKTYPCTNPTGCGHPHYVEAHGRAGWVAICDPEEACPPIPVEPEDLHVLEVSVERLRSEIARILGFNTTTSRSIASARAQAIGTFGPVQSTAYLMFPGDNARMARQVERLFQARLDPFVLFTPTGVHSSPEVDSALRRQGCLHIPLGNALILTGVGRFTVIDGFQEAFDRFVRCSAEGSGLVKTVERLDRNVEALARGTYELRKENEALRQLQSDGYLKFALRVDGEDFRVFAVIMALGNRKAAAGFLKIPMRTLYDRVTRWTNRESEYRMMARAVEWRKNVGRRIKVRLGDTLTSGESGDAADNPETVRAALDKIRDNRVDQRDYPTLLQDILETLKGQNAQNWSSVQAELIMIIKEEIPQ